MKTSKIRSSYNNVLEYLMQDNDNCVNPKSSGKLSDSLPSFNPYLYCKCMYVLNKNFVTLYESELEETTFQKLLKG